MQVYIAAYMCIMYTRVPESHFRIFWIGGEVIIRLNKLDQTIEEEKSGKRKREKRNQGRLDLGVMILEDSECHAEFEVYLED